MPRKSSDDFSDFVPMQQIGHHYGRSLFELADWYNHFSYEDGTVSVSAAFIQKKIARLIANMTTSIVFEITICDW